MPLIANPIRGNGDCVFHFLSSQTNSPDILTIRKQIGYRIQGLTLHIDNHQLKLPVQVAIQSLSESQPHLFANLANITGIEEYAKWIETPNTCLSSLDLEVVARACEMTIRQFEDTITPGEYIQTAEYNPGNSTIKNIYWDGKNAYAAMQEAGPFHPSQRMDVDPPPSFALAQAGNYTASGLKNTLHGNIYQLKLLIWFFHCAFTRHCSFRLATEMDQAKKFDDCVLIFQKPGFLQSHYLFLQAKHKQDDHKILTDKDLLDTSDQDFSLLKYFASYLEIKKDPDFQHGASYQFYLCTNIGFDFDPQNETTRLFKLSSALEAITNIDEMFDTKEPTAKKYRIKQGDYPGKAFLYGTLRGNHKLILASSLFAIMQEPAGKVDKTCKPFNDKSLYQWLLTHNIIDDHTRRLTNNFIKSQNLSPDATQFKTLYTQVESSKGEAWKDAEIDEFLQHLILAVNQPNEIRLGEMIAQKLGHEFNLINSEFIYAELQKAVLDWMKQKSGRFLNEKSAQTFFNDIRQTLSRLVLIGPTVEYLSKLDKLALSFKPSPNIRSFLTERTQTITIYYSPHHLLLGSLQVYHTLLDIYPAQQNDRYIFMTLEWAMRRKGRLIEALSKCPLLVLVCDHLPTLDEINELIEPLLNKALTSHQIILITEDEQKLRAAITTRKLPSVHATTNNFVDLTHDSQQSLKNWPVNFQGAQTQLGNLVEDFEQFINANVLSEFITNEVAQIGSPLESFAAENYYIARTFYRRVKLPVSDLKKITDVVFFMSGINPTELSVLVDPKNIFTVQEGKLKPLNLEPPPFDEVDSKYIILDKKNGESQAQFQKITQQQPHTSSSKEMHLFTRKKDAFIWLSATISTKNIPVRNNLHQYMQPTHIANLSTGFIVLSAEPGMGKTTYLAHLTKQLKRENPTVWNNSVNLLTIEDRLKENSFEEINDLIEFFGKDMTQLAKGMLRYRLKTQGNIIFFLDGFDEIQTAQQKKVIKLLLLLKKCKTETVIIATRPHMQQLLEEALDTVAYTLKPFDNEDAIHFLIQYWQENLDLGFLNKEKVNIYAKALITRFSESTNDTERTFIGIPLQAKLLAVAFADDFKAFYTAPTHEVHLPQNLSLHALYQRFIDTKYDILFREKWGSDAYHQFSFIKASLTANLEDAHQLLAFNTLFPKFRYSEEKIKPHTELIKRAGIVEKIGGTHQFIHRTFAEYFAAYFFITDLQGSSPQDTQAFLVRHIFKERHQVIRAFMESLINKESNNQLKQQWQAIIDLQLLARLDKSALIPQISLALSPPPQPARQPQKENHFNFALTKKSFEKSLKQTNLKNQPNIANELCRVAALTQDTSEMVIILQLLSRALQQPITDSDNDDILSYLPEIFWHYLTLCHKQKILFDNNLLQKFRDIRYRVNNYPQYTTMENECLDQLTQLYQYIATEQGIDTPFINQLDIAKTLYLAVIKPNIPAVLLPLLLAQLQNLYPQLPNYLVNNIFYKQLLNTLAHAYPSFMPGIRSFLLAQTQNIWIQEKAYDLLYQFYLTDSHTRLTATEIEHIFTDTLGVTAIGWSKYTLSLINRFERLTPKMVKILKDELSCALRGRMFDGGSNSRRYIEDVWREVLLPLLQKQQPDKLKDDIHPIALLSLTANFFIPNEISITFTTSMMQNLLQLITNTLNRPLSSLSTFTDYLLLLRQLKQQGFHLLHNEDTIIVQHPRDEFEHSLQLAHQESIYELLLLWKTRKPIEDLAAFTQACKDTLNTIQQTKPKLKSTQAESEKLRTSDTAIQAIAAPRKIKRGRSGTHEPDMEHPAKAKRFKDAEET